MKKEKSITLNKKDLYSQRSHHLKFEEHEEYLYAFISGEKNSLENSKKIWGIIAEECKKLGYSKLLIEEDVKIPMPMVDVYNLVNFLPTLSFTKIVVAFVDRQSEQEELNRFGELVGTNRGLRGKFFTKMEEAKKWLVSH